MLRILLTGLFIGLCSMKAAAVELLPFQASYVADWKQLAFNGSAERSLQKGKNTGEWLLSFEASMLVAGMRESSLLRVENNQIQPLAYNYQRTGLGKAKKIEQTFNWQTLQMQGSEKNKSFTLPLLPGMQDKSSYQLALQRDVASGLKTLHYTVLDGDDVDVYDFRVLGTEVVDTEVGQLNTVKVERVREPSKSQRKTTLWFASDWNYLLVKLNQIEKDGKEYTILLEEGMVNGNKVKGLNP